MAPRLGRPPSGNPRTHVIPVRFNDDELAALRKAATATGRKPGEYIRERSLAAAKRTQGRAS